MSDSLDMTGVWYGRWSAETPGVRPNSFIANLTETGGQVSGSITEPELPHRADILRAFVAGARAGAAVRFVKQYDGSGRLAHAVLYTGRINGTGTEVTGTWQFASYSGNFTMERESFSVEELEEREEIGEPIW